MELPNSGCPAQKFTKNTPDLKFNHAAPTTKIQIANYRSCLAHKCLIIISDHQQFHLGDMAVLSLKKDHNPVDKLQGGSLNWPWALLIWISPWPLIKIN